MFVFIFDAVKLRHVLVQMLASPPQKRHKSCSWFRSVGPSRATAAEMTRVWQTLSLLVDRNRVKRAIRSQLQQILHNVWVNVLFFNKTMSHFVLMPCNWNTSKCVLYKRKKSSLFLISLPLIKRWVMPSFHVDLSCIMFVLLSRS